MDLAGPLPNTRPREKTAPEDGEQQASQAEGTTWKLGEGGRGLSAASVPAAQEPYWLEAIGATESSEAPTLRALGMEEGAWEQGPRPAQWGPKEGPPGMF